MANYRRLISYIYAYEGGIKGKNVGFAKIENRKDQCRIQVSVRKVYVGSQDIGVYLMSTEGERLLGKMFIRGGAGEFRCMVQMDNGMSDCYGLTIHSIGDSWQSYTTIWEDAVAQTAEIQLAEVTAEHIRRQQEERMQQERKQQEQKQQEEQQDQQEDVSRIKIRKVQLFQQAVEQPPLRRRRRRTAGRLIRRSPLHGRCFLRPGRRGSSRTLRWLR